LIATLGVIRVVYPARVPTDNELVQLFQIYNIRKSQIVSNIDRKDP